MRNGAGKPVPVRVTGMPFGEQRLPGARERQIPGGGQNLGGADLAHDTHLPVGTTTLRDTYLVVVDD